MLDSIFNKKWKMQDNKGDNHWGNFKISAGHIQKIEFKKMQYSLLKTHRNELAF